MNTTTAVLTLGIALVVVGTVATFLSATANPSGNPHGGSMAGQGMMNGMGDHGQDMDEMEERCHTMMGEHDHEDDGGP